MAGQAASGGRSADNVGDGVAHDPLRVLSALRAELAHAEQTLCAGHHPVTGAGTQVARAVATGTHTARNVVHHVHVPAWLRVTRGENRWPVAVAMMVAIGLQVVLPDRLAPQLRWLFPGLEFALLVGLIVANPVRFNRESTVLRIVSLVLAGSPTGRARRPPTHRQESGTNRITQ